MYPQVGINHHWQKNDASHQLMLTMPIMVQQVGWLGEEVVVLAVAKAEEEVFHLLAVVAIIIILGKRPSTVE